MYLTLKRKWLWGGVILALLGIILNSPWFWRLIYPYPHRPLVESHAQTNNLDSLLVAALIRVESRWDTNARSKQGAIGLMQLMPATAQWVAEQIGVGYREDKLYQPDYNIRLGSWYLANLAREFDGSPVLILAAYNGGRGNVRKWLTSEIWDGTIEHVADIPFTETRNFVLRVWQGYHLYRWLYSTEQKLEPLPDYPFGRPAVFVPLLWAL